MHRHRRLAFHRLRTHTSSTSTLQKTRRDQLQNRVAALHRLARRQLLHYAQLGFSRLKDFCHAHRHNQYVQKQQELAVKHTLSRVRVAVMLVYGRWRRSDTQGVETETKTTSIGVQERSLPMPISPPGTLAIAFRVWHLHVRGGRCVMAYRRGVKRQQRLLTQMDVVRRRQRMDGGSGGGGVCVREKMLEEGGVHGY